jgi:aspartyl-tRNA synthetase
MERTLIADIVGKEGEEVTLQGWVDVRRDHGKLIFIDLRDRSGAVQIVFIPSDKELLAKAGTLRSEWVIALTGKVQKRPENMVNANSPTGAYEILATGLEVLNEATTPPIEVSGNDGMAIGEEVRLANRYIDLRRTRMQKNIRNRHKVISAIRKFFDKNHFVEVETPILTKSTPEGARDYLVPARLYPGHFYALPQSPQQYKQLLMASGLERYYQIARCFRDEDTRGDRQPEFTQLDLEMSFVKREDVMAVNEEVLIELVKTLYPHKKIQEIPFPQMSYKEAMEKYGNDRPDLRTDKNDPNLLAFCWVIDFPFFEKTDNGGLPAQSGWTFTHNPFSAPKPEDMENLMNKTNLGDILTTQYDVALNGSEIGGGSIRNHQPEALKKVFEIMGFEEERIQANFGHMLRALGSGCPPHGGIAWGLDRLLCILENEPNIREVIAFPKTGDGRDPMMQSPSPVAPDQLAELSIKISENKK